MCGGTRPTPPPTKHAPGLSPRVRGNQWSGRAVRRVSGSIPACAGEPENPPDPSGGFRVYPRVCGGTLVASIRWQLAGGLSPRVRGNHSAPRSRAVAIRSIPACAGEPEHWHTRHCRPPVYPRVCGGTDTWRKWSTSYYGLSPRVRGNLRSRYQRQSLYRSIPACAGEPTPAPFRFAALPVYPRVCGGTSNDG